MTTGAQYLNLNQRHAYVEINRRNRASFLPDVEPASADVANNVLDQTLNKSILRSLGPESSDPTTCFDLQDRDVKPVVKAIAAHAVEFWVGEAGYVDVNDAVSSSGRSGRTAEKIQSLGKHSIANSCNVKFIMVEAGNGLTGSETEAAQEIYGALSKLNPQYFSVAILGNVEVR